MNAEPLVSVCMTAYNHAPYIGRAIEGVLSQRTTFAVELVLSDDCSPDGTGAICRDYAARYPDRIRLLTGDVNVGMRANYRRTIEACRGRYVAMCDGDDWWCDPLKLQRQVEALEADPACGLSYTRSERRFETTALSCRRALLRFRPAAVRQYGRELHGRRAAGVDSALLRGGAAGRASRMADRRCADVDLVRGVQPHPGIGGGDGRPPHVARKRQPESGLPCAHRLLRFAVRHLALVRRPLRRGAPPAGAASASDARGAVGVVARRYDGGVSFALVARRAAHAAARVRCGGIRTVGEEMAATAAETIKL